MFDRVLSMPLGWIDPIFYEGTPNDQVQPRSLNSLWIEEDWVGVFC